MTRTAPDDDPWLDVAAQTGAGSGVLAQAGARIAVIEYVLPLDAQTGVPRKKTVPDQLRDALFGQPLPTVAEIGSAGGVASDVPPMGTYAILDAARVTNLPEVLESSRLEHRCLFSGKAYEDLKHAAPWIVRLEEGNTFARRLFTRGQACWHLWDSQPGIYIRSRASLDDLWRHFRKFTRIQDEAGNWFYFRFWEPRRLRAVVNNMDAADSERFLAGISGLVAIDPRGKAELVTNDAAV
ncbi:DUF4123 domain-containing protein [Paracoccus sp. DMF-8]|uniref:DUF4123 domain-containing protein n=1 Tax=Paracoccus sp. DMF-8 TaxID=3019445 RepID=UPI0023E3E349|nr:DUF4123 domain-containing protein [Paracoccus sp. DMF-8]MDF3607630.1 DUF4123 domain-containing protein [Paracoccus sp. DMF-8]